MSGSTSIGNDPRKGAEQSADSSPDDKSTLLPGDEALPGTAGTGEDICRRCGGSGKLDDGTECKNCGGTGKVTVGVGGA